VLDVDDQGRLLWVADSKTKAGKRTLETPTPLKPFLVSLCRGKNAEDLIFGRR